MSNLVSIEQSRFDYFTEIEARLHAALYHCGMYEANFAYLTVQNQRLTEQVAMMHKTIVDQTETEKTTKALFDDDVAWLKYHVKQAVDQSTTEFALLADDVCKMELRALKLAEHNDKLIIENRSLKTTAVAAKELQATNQSLKAENKKLVSENKLLKAENEGRKTEHRALQGEARELHDQNTKLIVDNRINRALMLDLSLALDDVQMEFNALKLKAMPKTNDIASWVGRLNVEPTPSKSNVAELKQIKDDTAKKLQGIKSVFSAFKTITGTKLSTLEAKLNDLAQPQAANPGKKLKIFVASVRKFRTVMIDQNTKINSTLLAWMRELTSVMEMTGLMLDEINDNKANAFKLMNVIRTLHMTRFDPLSDAEDTEYWTEFNRRGRVYSDYKKQYDAIRRKFIVLKMNEQKELDNNVTAFDTLLDQLT